MLVPEGLPPKTKTLFPPSDKAPSEVVNVCVVPERLIDPTPFNALSIISKLVFEVSPQVPDCSPVAGFSMPLFNVYVLAIMRLPLSS